MTHVCHAIGCDKTVPPKKLFCLPHWRMTPARIQALIWETYKPGQENRKDPTLRYLVVQAMAVAAVATKEKRLDEEPEKFVLRRIWQILPRMTDDDIAFVGRVYPTLTEADLEKLRVTRDNRAMGAGGNGT